MNKYYAPSIEKFYIGFEYEVGIETILKDYIEEGYRHIQSNYDWVPQICKSSPVPLSNIRVKYLDKEDIESFGFSQEKLPYQFFNGIYMLVTLDNHKIKIEHVADQVCLFEGVIKNKSELKKILKQLDINY